MSTRSLKLRDDLTAPIDLRKRRVSFKSDTRLEPPANRIVVPAPGGASDPRVGGATLRVYNSNGGSTDSVTVVLNAADWEAIGTSPVSGYRYVGPDPNGPVLKAKLTADFLQVRGGRANWTYTLDEPSQGRVAVRFTLGDGAGWCADAPAKVSGSPPSTARSDLPEKFVGHPWTPAPATCPALP